MLYGNEKTKNEILNIVNGFEKNYNKKVVFGSVLGSISLGLQRYDSDYDSRFLYLDQSGEDIHWDKLTEDMIENQIHQCYFPKNGYLDGVFVRNNRQVLKSDKEFDKKLFYDKVAFWELTSYIELLRNPQLNNKFSTELYHTVAWMFHSPFCWDPYGIKNKISWILDEMFVLEYEIQFYRNYILNVLNTSKVTMKKYLYCVYFALAIEYCIKRNRFAPIYSKSLLAMCDNEKLKEAIITSEMKYYSLMNDKIKSGQQFERKMTSRLSAERNSVIDSFINEVLHKTEGYCTDNIKIENINYIEAIIDIVLESVH